MYKEIYNDPLLFKNYLTSISFTIESKVQILNKILEKTGIPNNKNICFLPSDIGMYYFLYLNIAPENKFLLIDKHDKPLEYISSNSAHENTYYLQADVTEEIHWNNKLDYAINIMALHHILKIRTFFNNVFNLLDTNGQFIIVTFSNEDSQKNIMSNFFKTDSQFFTSLKEIEYELSLTGFTDIVNEKITFNVEVNINDIPKIFNKYSNSFLFKQTDKSIKDFQYYLQRTAKNSTVEYCNNYTLLLAKKL